MAVGERAKTGARTKKRPRPSFRALSHRHFGFLDARSRRSSGRKKETTRSLSVTFAVILYFSSKFVPFSQKLLIIKFIK